MKYKKFLTTALAVCMLLGTAACGTAETASSGSSGQTASASSSAGTASASKGDIAIGCLQDITGTTSTMGKMVQAGAQWAVDEINKQGGIDGKNVRLVTYDTKADVQEAISAFNRMCTTDNVVAVIGPPVANICIAIAPLSEQYKVPVMEFALDTRANLKDDGSAYKNMFLLQPSAKQQGAIMANFAVKERNLKKFGIIFNQSNAYSVSLVDAFNASIKTLSGASVAAQVPYQANDKDFKTMLNKITSQNVDAIFCPNYTQELILIVQQARAIGFDKPIICGLDAAPPFVSLCGPEADGVVYINNISEQDPKTAEISKAYKAKSNVDATNKFFLGYDVASIVMKEIKEVGSDPAKVRDAIETLKDYEGYTGKITIDPKTHQTTGLEMMMTVIENQKGNEIKRYSVPEE